MTCPAGNAHHRLADAWTALRVELEPEPAGYDRSRLAGQLDAAAAPEEAMVAVAAKGEGLHDSRHLSGPP